MLNFPAIAVLKCFHLDEFMYFRRKYIIFDPGNFLFKEDGVMQFCFHS